MPPVTEPPTPPQAPPSQVATTVDNVTDVLRWAVTLAFPAAAPIAAVVEKIIDGAAPWIAQVLSGKKVTPEMLSEMRAHLNSLGPSFPEAGGYSNPWAGGANPAPGTAPEQAPPNSMSLTVNGVKITLSAETAEALVALVTKLLAK